MINYLTIIASRYDDKKENMEAISRIIFYLKLLVVLAVFIFAAIWLVSAVRAKMPVQTTANNYTNNNQSNTNRSIESVLLETSKKMNKNLPMMIDSDTRTDLTMVIGKQFHIKNTIVNLAKNDVDGSAIDRVVNKIAASHCNDARKKELLDLGVTYHFTYLDKNGDMVATKSISSNNCKH